MNKNKKQQEKTLQEKEAMWNRQAYENAMVDARNESKMEREIMEYNKSRGSRG